MKKQFKLVGVTFNDRQRTIQHLSNGAEVIAIKETNNRYDADAIIVIDLEKNELGHISNEQKMEFHALMGEENYVVGQIAQKIGGQDGKNFGVIVEFECDEQQILISTEKDRRLIEVLIEETKNEELDWDCHSAAGYDGFVEVIVAQTGPIDLVEGYVSSRELANGDTFYFFVTEGKKNGATLKHVYIFDEDDELVHSIELPIAAKLYDTIHYVSKGLAQLYEEILG